MPETVVSHCRNYKLMLRNIISQKLTIKSYRILLVIQAYHKFNFNGMTKKRFMERADLNSHNFAADIKQLVQLNVLRQVEGFVMFNPDLVFSGTEACRNYRRLCWEQNVVELEDFKSSEPTDKDYEDACVKIVLQQKKHLDFALNKMIEKRLVEGSLHKALEGCTINLDTKQDIAF